MTWPIAFLVFFCGIAFAINRGIRQVLEGNAPPDFPKGVYNLPLWMHFGTGVVAYFPAYALATFTDVVL